MHWSTMPPPEPPYSSSMPDSQPAELGQLLVELLVVELLVVVRRLLALLLRSELALDEVADRLLEVALLVGEADGLKCGGGHALRFLSR